MLAKCQPGNRAEVSATPIFRGAWASSRSKAIGHSTVGTAWRLASGLRAGTHRVAVRSAPGAAGTNIRRS